MPHSVWSCSTDTEFNIAVMAILIGEHVRGVEGEGGGRVPIEMPISGSSVNARPLAHQPRAPAVTTAQLSDTTGKGALLLLLARQLL